MNISIAITLLAIKKSSVRNKGGISCSNPLSSLYDSAMS